MASSLTARFCDGVKPIPGRQVDYLDSEVPGLALRVSGRGRKVWTFRYRNGASKQCRVTIGVYAETLNLAEARTRARRLQTLVDDGVDPASERRIAKSRERDREISTFDDLVQAYFEACEQGIWTPKGKVKRKRSLDDERNVYRLHVKPHFAKLPLKEVTRSLVRRRLREMYLGGIGAQTNKAHQMIRGTFSFAIGEEIEPDIILYNPGMGFGRVAPIKPRMRTLKDEEWRIFLRALDEMQRGGEIVSPAGQRVCMGPQMAIILKLCSFTLQRKGEIVGMRISELDLDQGVWIVPPERMKGGRLHLVPLSDRAIALIREAIALCGDLETDCVFPNPRDPSIPMRADSVSYAMRLLNQVIGIKDATPHDLRRTGATAMTSERLEISPLIRSRVLGHAFDTGGGAAVTSLHYDANSYARAKRVALAAWQELLVHIVSGAATPSRTAEQLVGYQQALLLEWAPAG
ncbi:tyrosine-type recombinase/integrase [Phenylobacterium sp.]|uniref:tyrosine-type recombinase/integrase n=1 Tax=Phenylobacterium sp. TaxID=1871053 RepID=UPI002FCA9076